MESLGTDQFLKFRPNMLEEVRTLYNLDKPGTMADAITIFQEWLKKQDHFVKKDFDRDYLERAIIRSKGSIEKAKQRLDKLCTARTLLPSYFYNGNIKDLTHLEFIHDVVFPNPTEDNYRVYLLRNTGKDFKSQCYTNFFLRLIHALEYLNVYDYATGMIMILDYRETNLVALAKNSDITEIQNFMNIFIDCYGLRIKGIHLISTSKFIEVIVGICKKVFSAKIGNRIYVHKTLEGIYEHVDKKLFPSDYGGNEKPLMELHEHMLQIGDTKEQQALIKTMNAACTNEGYRRTDKFNEDCLGMPGTFRTLSVD